MTKIIDFVSKKQKKKPLIWVCSCGCSSFRLFNDGGIECASCDIRREVGGWTPPDTDEMYEGEEPYYRVEGNADVDFVKNRMAARVKEPDCCTVTLLFGDGTVSTWSTAETEEQIEWVERKLKEASELIKMNLEYAHSPQEGGGSNDN